MIKTQQGLAGEFSQMDPSVLLLTGGFIIVGSLIGYAVKRYLYPVNTVPPEDRNTVPPSISTPSDDRAAKIAALQDVPPPTNQDAVPGEKKEDPIYTIEVREFVNFKYQVYDNFIIRDQVNDAIQSEQRAIRREVADIKEHVTWNFKQVEKLFTKYREEVATFFSLASKTSANQEAAAEENNQALSAVEKRLGENNQALSAVEKRLGENNQLLSAVEKRLGENNQLLNSTQSALNYTAIRVDNAASRVEKEVKKVSEEVKRVSTEVKKISNEISETAQATDILATESVVRYEEFEDELTDKLDFVLEQLKKIATFLGAPDLVETTKGTAKEVLKESGKDEKMALPGVLGLVFLLRAVYANFNGWGTFCKDILKNKVIIFMFASLIVRQVYFVLGVTPVIGYLTIPLVGVLVAYAITRLFSLSKRL